MLAEASLHNDENRSEHSLTNNRTDSHENPGSSNANIYRYKFTQDFMDELHKFSKVHQYDDRKTFKDAWNVWLEENGDLVQDEIQRLESLNYDGDILDKMFKSARYYFKKKGTLKPEPKKRRQYLSVQKELLDAMDQHILKKKSNPDYKPADGFTDFCSNQLDLLKEEVTRLVLEYQISDATIIKDKIKKTYKNRYFILRERDSNLAQITN